MGCGVVCKQLQNSNTTPESPSDGNTTVYIIIGVVVPVVLIGIGALLVYIWYRKKYPVRMVMGKDFAKFSNPAYNKRNSTLTLVREDAANYWDTFQPSGVQNPGMSVVPEDEDCFPGTSRVEVLDETDATAKMEDIEKMIQSGGDSIKNGETNSDVVSKELNKESEAVEKKSKKPRKAMLIINDDLEYFDSGFEMVSESSNGEHGDSDNSSVPDNSSVNDSTGTHTVALSTDETTDASETSESSRQESGEDINRESIKSEHDVAQTNSVIAAEDSPKQGQEIGDNNEDNEREYKDTNGKIIIETAVNIDKRTEEQTNSMNMTDEDSSKEIKQTLQLNISENETHPITDVYDTNDPTAKNRDSETSLDNIEFESNGSNIYLEAVPPTPTVVVPDSIIFESESCSPIHLDSVGDTPRRQRRAHTIECVMPMGSSNSSEGHELVVKKDWRSFDDIDKIVNPTGGVNFFEPIHKFKPESPTKSEDDSENEQPSPGDSHSEMPFQSQEMSKTIDTVKTYDVIKHCENFEDAANTSSDIETNIAEKEGNLTTAHSGLLVQETIDKSQEESVNSSLTLSFEVLDTEDSADKRSEEVFDEIAEPDRSGKIVPLSDDNSDIFTATSVQIQMTGIQLDDKVHTDTDEMFTSSNSEQSIKIMDAFEENNESVEKGESASITMSDNFTNSAFDDENIMTAKSVKDDVPESTDVETKMRLNETNITESLVDLMNPSILELQPAINDSSSPTITNANENTNTLSSSEHKSQLLDITDESKDANTVDSNTSVKRHTADLSLFVDISGDETSKENIDGNISQTETFQQFETSLLGTSTPTSSTLKDPLVAFKPDLLDFDFEKSSTNSESSESFNITDATQSIDKSFDEDSFTAEPSHSYSFDLIAKGGGENIPENTQPKKRIAVSLDNLVSLDDDDDDNDKSGSSTENSSGDDFTDILKDLADKSESGPNAFIKIEDTSPTSDKRDSGLSLIAENTSFEVLKDDTEA